MKEKELKTILKQHDLSENEIERFIQFYNYALENEIIYPFYYALSKLKI